MTDRLVPGSPDGIPISGLAEFLEHLHLLESAPSTPINIKLLDDIELQLNETNTLPLLLPAVYQPLTSILKSTDQDPTPLLSLTIKLLAPLPFTDALLLASPADLLSALSSPLSGANLLALAVLHKAAQRPSDAAILSTHPLLVTELVRCWLDAPDVRVSERAAKVLGDLLETDCSVLPEPRAVSNSSNNHDNVDINGVEGPRAPGHGRLWRLLLDRPMLGLIVTFCSPSPPSPSSSTEEVSEEVSGGGRSHHQTSLSQGRLLRLLARLSTLDIRALNRTPFPDLFPLPAHIVQITGQGLLQWAALGMVDTAADELMHLTVIDFFETFVSVMRVAGRSAEEDGTVGNLVRVAVREDESLAGALRRLPDGTVEEEAEDLREYINDIMGV